MSGENGMTGMRVEDFDFELPPELIAQEPPKERGQSRMLEMDRADGRGAGPMFSDLPELLRAGDVLVLNDSRVIPARLYARRTTVREKQQASGSIEVLLTETVRRRRVAHAGKAGTKGCGQASGLSLLRRWGRWSLMRRLWSAASLASGFAF